MVASRTVLIPTTGDLTHAEAARVSRLAAAAQAQTIVLDLSESHNASTAAFARLVLLRREMLPAGRDIRICGLHDRAAKLFEVHRLDAVLPRISAPPAQATRTVRGQNRWRCGSDRPSAPAKRVAEWPGRVP